MKICILNGGYYPEMKGGAESYIKFISSQLTALGHDVLIITTKPFENMSSLIPKVGLDGDTRIYRFYPLNFCHRSSIYKRNVIIRVLWYLIDSFNLHSLYCVKRVLNVEKPDIIWTFNFKGISILSAFSINPRIHVHSIQDIQLCDSMSDKDNLLESMFWKIISKINKCLIHSPSVIISPSEFALKKHLDNGFFKNSSYQILSNPSKIQILNGIKPKRDNLFHILFVGDISKGKGIYTLVDSFKDLNDINAILQFVGTGSELGTLKKYAQNINNVFIYGYMSGSDLTDMYLKANVTVVPSIIYDNFPSVILESFSCGTPVIGSKIGGIPEIIQDNVNGKLFEPDSVDELSSLLKLLYYNPHELDLLQKGAYESAKKYQAEHHTHKLLKIFFQMTSNEKASSSN